MTAGPYPIFFMTEFLHEGLGNFPCILAMTTNHPMTFGQRCVRLHSKLRGLVSSFDKSRSQRCVQLRGRKFPKASFLKTMASLSKNMHPSACRNVLKNIRAWKIETSCQCWQSCHHHNLDHNVHTKSGCTNTKSSNDDFLKILKYDQNFRKLNYFIHFVNQWVKFITISTFPRCVHARMKNA